MQIYILLTQKCNLHCSMCIRGKQSGDCISFSTLNSIFNRGDFDNHDIILTGGEPTLYNRLSDVAKLLSQTAHIVSITTNGTDSNVIQELIGIKNVMFQVSLDGDKIAHDVIRGAGTFDKVQSTIDILEKFDMTYTVSSVVSNKNIDGIFRLENLLRQRHKMKYWNISYEMPFGSATVAKSMSALEWNRFVDKLIGNAKVRIKIKKLFPFELYDRFADKLRNISKQRRSFNCGSGRDKLYVYPDFSVYPCTCLENFCVGNLEQESLSQILDNKKIEQFQNYHVNSESVCASCQYLQFCRGGCIGMSVHYCGGLGYGDIRCPRIQAAKVGL